MHEGEARFDTAEATDDAETNGDADANDAAADHRPRRRSKRWPWVAGAAVVLVGGLVWFASVNPGPGALVIRWVFNRDATKVTAALEKHAPDGIDSITDVAYRPDDPAARLDVYFPASATGALPTVVWTHGGAWIAGNRTNYAGYYQLLASRGYTVVSLDYSLGPGATYPTAVHQLNDAHAYLLKNAERLRVDPSSIVLAGDSAGAQLTSQMATAVTNPAYADTLGIRPSLAPDQLVGVVLNCGIYDMTKMSGGSGIIGWGIEESLWAYTGHKKFADSDAGKQMSTLHQVTADFPPTYITGGNGDPLTDAQSKPLAKQLTGLGVDVDTLFFSTSHRPELGHEYQFDLDNADGMTAFERTVKFLDARTT